VVVETFVEAVVAVEVPRKHDEDHAELVSLEETVETFY
jgi:pyrimidine deaminase RibD-like protein